MEKYTFFFFFSKGETKTYLWGKEWNPGISIDVFEVKYYHPFKVIGKTIMILKICLNVCWNATFSQYRNYLMIFYMQYMKFAKNGKGYGDFWSPFSNPISKNCELNYKFYPFISCKIFVFSRRKKNQKLLL